MRKHPTCIATCLPHPALKKDVLPQLEALIRAAKQRTRQFTHEAVEKRLQATACAQEIPPNGIMGKLHVQRANECDSLAKSEGERHKTLCTLREVILQARRNADSVQLMGATRDEMQDLLDRLHGTADLESLVDDIREQYETVHQHSTLLMEPLVPSSTSAFVVYTEHTSPTTTTTTTTKKTTRAKEGALG